MTGSERRKQLIEIAKSLFAERGYDGTSVEAAITAGTYATLLNDAVNQVASILAGDFSRRGLDPDLAPLYAQALVGSVSMTAQWWLDVREPPKEVVAAHVVNLCWNGLTHLESDPKLED